MKVILGISNRHVHLTEEDYKILFKDEPLNKAKDLLQKGQYASDKKVSIKTAKNTINNVRLLGPLRKYTQVEISKTDSFTLGLNPPVRDSGDLEGAEMITIVGPYGEVTKSCCILATRHLHINTEDLARYGLTNGQHIKAKIVSEKTTVFEDVHVKADPTYVLELHLDTDDGNGALAKTGDEIEVII